MRAALAARVILEQYGEAARSAVNLSELELTLGETAAAIRDAEKSVEFAEHSGDAAVRIFSHTTLADARHQAGEQGEALARFHEAEARQAKRQPEYPLLYSLRGFQYWELLLGKPERMAWITTLVANPAATDRPELEPQFDTLREVEQRATQTLKWAAELSGVSLLDFALIRLTLGRLLLYRAVLEDSSFGPARGPLTAAVDGLRTAGDLTRVPWGFLTRAWLRFMEGDPDGAKADLDEAWQIAERGSMKLHMADIHLHRARLFRDRTALDAAARLIEQTGYHRRDEELADAREALGSLAE